MEVLIKYLHKRNYSYKSNKGLAEAQIKRYFQKRGYEVWRGSYISYHPNRLKEFHPDKIQRLENAIKGAIDLNGLIQLILFAKTNAGLPDFIVKKGSDLKFVEVKFENETLQDNQVEMIKFLKNLGLEVIIIRLSSNGTVYEKTMDLNTKKTKKKSYIPKLRLKW